MEDHVRADDGARRLWAGEDLDLTGPLATPFVLAAAQVESRIGEVAGPFLGMRVGPSALDDVEPLARAVYESGWRPPPAEGPTRDELGAILRDAVPA
ncbi:hypothetical protein AD006_22450 [Pseudonocardia sp. EC080610-09]|nr:hypothetical protein FRP1_14785 [Pseudonocardia sp. EC080625-04]ALL77374.1 hypothetical protein AD006_22450 [Pseudonocardia sp. EC080610-09]ALL80289.1 hypothetical protein AD017_02035 [Pseudonocardia sp. EC080619-01]